MPFDYRNFQQKSRRYKSGKGHQKQPNYHAKGKHSIHQKNKYSILRNSKRSDQRNSRKRHDPRPTHLLTDRIESPHYNKISLTLSDFENKYPLPYFIKQQISKNLDFDVDDADLKVIISISKTKMVKQKRKKIHAQSHLHNTMENEKHQRIIEKKKRCKRKLISGNYRKNILMKLIGKVGQNVFFDVICKRFLYPWEIVNLFFLCKRINRLITSYDANNSYFKSLFLDRNNTQQYLSRIEKMIDSFETEETQMFLQLKLHTVYIKFTFSCQ